MSSALPFQPELQMVVKGFREYAVRLEIRLRSFELGKSQPVLGTVMVPMTFESGTGVGLALELTSEVVGDGADDGNDDGETAGAFD